MKNRPHKSHNPYRRLGNRLRSFREQRSQSVQEVSGAVEIDVAQLEKIESGEQRPSEEVLLLLISYFDVAEEEAASLWTLAGFDDMSDSPNPDHNSRVAFVLPMDVRIVYTDIVHVAGNDHGVVMNFMQTGGPANQPLAVARVGMSREHAQHVVSVLTQALEHLDKPKQPRSLPPASQP